MLHPGTPTLDPPTLVALGVVLPITGDDNFTATVRMRYRVTGTMAWHDAMPLQHVHVEVVQGLARRRSIPTVMPCAGNLDGGGTITDLAVRDASINGDQRSGALVGYINSGTVQRVASFGANCVIESTTLLAYHRGGLVGETAVGGVVIDAFSTCIVKNNGVGLAGIVGHNAGSITNAYYSSAVTLSGEYRIGGIAGWHYMGATMANVFSAAAMLGASASPDVGGVSGTNSGTMTNAYYDSSFSIRNAGTGGLSIGATAVDGSTGYFFEPMNPPLSSWDFTTVWTAQTGTYPTLTWLIGR